MAGGGWQVAGSGGRWQVAGAKSARVELAVASRSWKVSSTIRRGGGMSGVGCHVACGEGEGGTAGRLPLPSFRRPGASRVFPSVSGDTIIFFDTVYGI